MTQPTWVKKPKQFGLNNPQFIEKKVVWDFFRTLKIKKVEC
jgi:hypothetical protein